mmetsp:Transcript_13500/g.16349  ORF Transcript_13500/g.16349 Transcript_13500/m.16349 type:complete len:642 (+) Transcript_13500:146-2071(+)
MKQAFISASLLVTLFALETASGHYVKHCNKGEALVAGSCVECPEGSYEQRDQCFHCYQHNHDSFEEGATSCSLVKCGKNNPSLAYTLNVDMSGYGKVMENMDVPVTDGSCKLDEDLTKGAIDELQLRFLPANYEEGTAGGIVDDHKPNPREVSNRIFAQNGSLADQNDANTNLLLIFFGQFIDHDITLIDENHVGDWANFSVPEGDEQFSDLDTLGFPRSSFVFKHEARKGRQYINKNTAWLDLSSVYGNDNGRGDSLRSGELGELLHSTINGEMYPPLETTSDDEEKEVFVINHPEECNEACLEKYRETTHFYCGDKRANENPMLTSFHTLFLREHNRIAKWFREKYNTQNDDLIFENARIRNILQYQKMVWDFLETILGKKNLDFFMGKYDKFNTKKSCEPGMEIHFTTAAYRFGHSGLRDILPRVNNTGIINDAQNMLLKDVFDSPNTHYDDEDLLHELFNGVYLHKHEPLDVKVVDAVRNHLFENTGHRLDLVSLNIQRGRDHGLQTFNWYRQALAYKLFLHPKELPMIETFEELTQDEDLAAELKDLYGHIHNIDLFVAGLAEVDMPGSMLGKTFTVSIIEQFKRLRDCDPIWFQSGWVKDMDGMDTKLSLGDIIAANTKSTLFEEGADSFKVPNV